jgi:hypothetical protein
MQVSTAQAGSGIFRRFTTPFGLSLDPGELLEQLIRVSYYLPEAANPFTSNRPISITGQAPWFSVALHSY